MQEARKKKKDNSAKIASQEITVVPVTLMKLYEAESACSLKLMSCENVLGWERGGGIVVISVLQ